MLAYIMLLLFAYKLLHRCNQERYLQIVIMKIKILWKFKYSWVYCLTNTCIYPDCYICREKEKRKKLYIMREQNMKWWHLFLVNHCLILLYTPSSSPESVCAQVLRSCTLSPMRWCTHAHPPWENSPSLDLSLASLPWFHFLRITHLINWFMPRWKW